MDSDSIKLKCNLLFTENLDLVRWSSVHEFVHSDLPTKSLTHDESDTYGLIKKSWMLVMIQCHYTEKCEQDIFFIFYYYSCRPEKKKSRPCGIRTTVR